jgi:hypothetical protein
MGTHPRAGVFVTPWVGPPVGAVMDKVVVVVVVVVVLLVVVELPCKH